MSRSACAAQGDRLERWLNALWYGERPGVVARAAQWLLLAPLSGLFAVVTTLRRRAYASGLLAVRTCAAPVVVVGNVTAGGTGKTPLVIWLARALAARGMKLGIITRGYGGNADGEVREVTAHSDVRQSGDEPLLIARATSAMVMVSKDRAAGAAALAGRGAQLILSDDGLQHYRMARDLEIAVIDGARGLGNGWLLPAGPLREREERLNSVDVIVYNDTSMAATVQGNARAAGYSMRLRPTAVRNLRTGERRELGAFTSLRDLHAVAGIGHPQRFFDMLRAAGLRPIEHAFADHHAFVARDLHFVDAAAVLMTAKDAVKCETFADERVWEVDVEACFSDGDAERLVAQVCALANESRYR